MLAARAFAARLDRPEGGGELYDFFAFEPRHARARAFRRVSRSAQPYTWWFPVVGRVPYKGYFDFDLAKKAEETLYDRGFDVYLRPSPAFSTLGWFNDPLLSTSLRADTLDLANTVVHELTHNTFYAPGSAVFNESFANFVGARGSAWFFRSRGSPMAGERVDAEWSDEKALSRFWERSISASTRRSVPTRRIRRPVLPRATRSTRGPSRCGYRPRASASLDRSARARANPARQRGIARASDLQHGSRRLRSVWAKENGDLKKTIARIIVLAKSRPKDPFGAMKDSVAARWPKSITAEVAERQRSQRRPRDNVETVLFLTRWRRRK